MNTSISTYVNYLRLDPPFLLRRVDLLSILALALGLVVRLGIDGFVLLIPAGLIYLMFAVRVRVAWRFC